MPNQTITALIAQMDATEGVIDSAVAFINGFAARLEAAVAAAIANGATEAELLPVATEITEIREKSDALAAAIAANP